MSNAVEVTDATFDADVINSSTPVLVDFWAQWCPPCHILSPVLEEIAGEQNGSLTVAKVNVDENPAVAGRFSITSLPTMILYSGGEAVEKMIGAHPKERILQTVTPYIE